jgi:LytS/YehU family sensor histidine kinase
MSVLLEQLIPLCPAIEGRKVVLTLQAVAIGTAYVAVARVVALMSDRAQQQTELARQSELRALRSRLETLKAQMNPHFLFNALNSVASLIPDEPQLAETTVERLAGVLQYTLLASQREFVTLEEELAVVRDYLEIEKARFDGRLQTTIDVSPDLYQRHIPPLLLQPLVENAVLHGLAEARSGVVKVCGRAEQGATVLTVTDGGVGPGKSKRQGNRMGLGHVRERLALTYGDASSVVVREATDGGFECELRIPEGR